MVNNVAWLVARIGPDLTIKGIGVFSEPSPTACGEGVWAVIYESRVCDDFGAACLDVYNYVVQVHPWLESKIERRGAWPPAVVVKRGPR